MTVDCVVFDDRDRLLLIRRRYPPFAGQFVLPGGFVDYGETTEAAARRELTEETGLKAKDLRLIGVYSDPKRDPRGHTCSVVFLTRVTRATATAGDDAAAAEWVPLAGRYKMAFDHGKCLNDARRVLRKLQEG